MAHTRAPTHTPPMCTRTRKKPSRLGDGYGTTIVTGISADRRLSFTWYPTIFRSHTIHYTATVTASAGDLILFQFFFFQFLFRFIIIINIYVFFFSYRKRLSCVQHCYARQKLDSVLFYYLTES